MRRHDDGHGLGLDVGRAAAGDAAVAAAAADETIATSVSARTFGALAQTLSLMLHTLCLLPKDNPASRGASFDGYAQMIDIAKGG